VKIIKLFLRKKRNLRSRKCLKINLGLKKNRLYARSSTRGKDTTFFKKRGLICQDKRAQGSSISFRGSGVRRDPVMRKKKREDTVSATGLRRGRSCILHLPGMNREREGKKRKKDESVEEKGPLSLLEEERKKEGSTRKRTGPGMVKQCLWYANWKRKKTEGERSRQKEGGGIKYRSLYRKKKDLGPGKIVLSSEITGQGGIKEAGKKKRPSLSQSARAKKESLLRLQNGGQTREKRGETEGEKFIPLLGGFLAQGSRDVGGSHRTILTGRGKTTRSGESRSRGKGDTKSR